MSPSNVHCVGGPVHGGPPHVTVTLNDNEAATDSECVTPVGMVTPFSEGSTTVFNECAAIVCAPESTVIAAWYFTENVPLTEPLYVRPYGAYGGSDVVCPEPATVIS